MPILQSRMNRILEAGEAYRDRYKILRGQISHNLALLSAGRLTLEQFRAAIAADITIAPEYMPADEVLTEERTRYNLTYIRNISERRRIARRREGKGVLPDTPPLAPDDTHLRLQLGLEADALETNEIDEAVRGWAEDAEVPEGWTEADEAEYRKAMGRPPKTESPT